MENEEKIFNLNEEDLKDLTPEQLVDLKIEINDALAKIDELIEMCKE